MGLIDCNLVEKIEKLETTLMLYKDEIEELDKDRSLTQKRLLAKIFDFFRAKILVKRITQVEPINNINNALKEIAENIYDITFSEDFNFQKQLLKYGIKSCDQRDIYLGYVLKQDWRDLLIDYESLK